MIRPLSFCLVAIFAYSACTLPAAAADDPKPPEPATQAVPADKPKEADAHTVSFRRHIGPLFVKNCQACHGSKKAESNYRTNTFALLKKPGDFETAPVTPGDVDDSEIFRLLTSDDPDERMPLEGDPFTKEQIDLVRRWISQGAKFDGPGEDAQLASYIPKQKHPAAPSAYPAPIPITAVAFSPDGKKLAIGGYYEVTIWNPGDGKLIRRIGNIAERTFALAYSSDGRQLVVAGGVPGRLGEVKIVNPTSGAEIRTLFTTTDVVYDAAVSPDGKLLATASADRAIRIHQLSDGRQLRLIENHADWVMAVVFSPDGKQIASASRDKTAKVFEVNSGRLVTTYSGHADQVYGVVFKADGKQVYSTGRDKKVHLWKVADGKKSADMGGFGGEVYKIIRSGGNLFASSADRSVRQYQESDHKPIRTFGDHPDWVFSLSAHIGAKRLAAGNFDGSVRIWNLEDGKALLTFIAAPGYREENQ